MSWQSDLQATATAGWGKRTLSRRGTQRSKVMECFSIKADGVIFEHKCLKKIPGLSFFKLEYNCFTMLC